MARAVLNIQNSLKNLYKCKVHKLARINVNDIAQFEMRV
jgi:hypothetical protein